MKREEVNEIAASTSVDVGVEGVFCYHSELEAFANEVERRTIEKCAQLMDAIIRALANQQEKQNG